MTIIDSDPRPPGHSSDASSGLARRMVTSPLGIAVLAVAALLAVDAGGTDDGPGVCLFRRCTGGYCPGCGVTRSARHVTRGQWSAAWNDHPFVIFALFQAIVAGVVWTVARVLGRSLRWARPLAFVAAANLVLLIGIWIVRLVDGSIPRFF